MFLNDNPIQSKFNWFSCCIFELEREFDQYAKEVLRAYQQEFELCNSERAANEAVLEKYNTKDNPWGGRLSIFQIGLLRRYLYKQISLYNPILTTEFFLHHPFVKEKVQISLVDFVNVHRQLLDSESVPVRNQTGEAIELELINRYECFISKVTNSLDYDMENDGCRLHNFCKHNRPVNLTGQSIASFLNYVEEFQARWGKMTAEKVDLFIAYAEGNKISLHNPCLLGCLMKIFDMELLRIVEQYYSQCYQRGL